MDETQYKSSLISGFAGVIVTTILTMLGLEPAVGILAGSITVVIALRQFEPLRPYAIAGTFYLLAMVGVIALAPIFPEIYIQTALFPLGIAGAISSLGLVLRNVLRRIIAYVVTKVTNNKKTGQDVGKTVSSIIATIIVAWGVIKAKERIARSAVVSAAGLGSFIFEMLDLNLLWFIESLNLNLFILAGSIAVGFHTLASWHAAWLLKDNEHIRRTAEGTKEKAQSAGSKSKEKIDAAQETLTAKLNDAKKAIGSTS